MVQLFGYNRHCTKQNCNNKNKTTMGTFFWDFQDHSDIGREWALFIINLLAFLFTAYALARTARHHRQFVFELVPLSINLLATIILLLIKLFEKGYEFDIVGYIIEIFTYFLFGYTFSVMHARLIADRAKLISKACNILFIVFSVTTVVLLILVMASVITHKCNSNFALANLGGLVFEFISYVPTVYFGWDILRKITKKHQEEKEDSKQQEEAEENFISSVSDQYIRERKKQIRIVLAAYTVSLVLRLVILLVDHFFKDYFQCEQVEGVVIITSDRWFGQVVLYLIEINQLIPHVIIPVALYVVPLQKGLRSSKLSLVLMPQWQQQTLLDQEDDDEEVNEHRDSIQRSITSKMRLSGSVKDDSSPEVSPTSSNI